jgi:AcrR family transcriptional regulator
MATCTTPCSAPPSGCWNATGLPGLTLRAVAREAGVSHAAPTHHFGDLTGL